MKTLAVFIVVLLYSVTLSSQERITLLFVGDLMQHQAQIDAAHVSEGKYDYSSCFSLIKEQISQGRPRHEEIWKSHWGQALSGLSYVQRPR